MSYSEYFKQVKGELSYIDLVTYLLSNFRNIEKPEDLVSDIRSKIVDITDAPEKTLMRIANYSGHTTNSFVFQENSIFNGVFDLDFINGKLANVRIQLFAKGFLSSIKMNKRYGKIFRFTNDKFGEAVEDEGYYRLIWDSGDGLIITLRKIPESLNGSISFTITDRKFAF